MPADLIEERCVFGRFSPWQKVQIIHSVHGRGRRVAMIGDGVNDVLPIKNATLGVAMGDGSRAAKTVAGVVLRTNDFGLLPLLLDEGSVLPQLELDFWPAWVSLSLIGGLHHDPEAPPLHCPGEGRHPQTPPPRKGPCLRPLRSVRHPPHPLLQLAKNVRLMFPSWWLALSDERAGDRTSVHFSSVLLEAQPWTSP